MAVREIPVSEMTQESGEDIVDPQSDSVASIVSSNTPISRFSIVPLPSFRGTCFFAPFYFPSVLLAIFTLSHSPSSLKS